MDSTTPTLSGLEPLMSIEELSEYLNVPVRTLYDWRLAGKGPCAVHIGRQIRYFVADGVRDTDVVIVPVPRDPVSPFLV